MLRSPTRLVPTSSPRRRTVSRDVSRQTRRAGVPLVVLVILAAMMALSLSASADSAMPDAMPDPDAPDLDGAARVEALIERIRLQQKTMETMRATFVQRKESDLFLEPEEATGTFWYRAPSSVRWDFAAPDQTTVVLDGDTMTTWHRDLGTAERMTIGEQADKITEYIAAPSSLETLERYFQVRVTFPSDADAPYVLQLKPAFERVERRIKGMTIHFDRRGFYPVFLRYLEPDGDVTEYRFEDVEINETLEDDRFVLELPDDVEVDDIAFGSRRDRG